MTERKKLKKKLSLLKSFLNRLPILIDCSFVYGDDTYKQSHIDDIKKEITELEMQISKMPIPSI